MPFQALPSKFIATGLFAATVAGGIYAINIRNHIAFANQIEVGMIRSRSVSEAFKQSEAVRNVVNHRQHRSTADSRSITLSIPSKHRHTSDQAILARLVKGFYGGVVLGPERVVLQTLGRTLVDFSKAPPEKAIWSSQDLSETELPAPQAVVFGAFQTLGARVSTPEDQDKNFPTSYIDFGFGSDRGQFAGVHRFAIMRSQHGLEDQTVQIHFESMACNPTVDRPCAPEFVFWFHRAYADLLFKEAVSYVQEGFAIGGTDYQ